MKGQAALFRSENDEYETPADLFDMLHMVFRFTVDPCASIQSHMLPRYWTIKDDGLEQSWTGETLYINPPYSNCSGWVEKAATTYEDGHSQSVLLIPARTDTSYWQDHIFPKATAIIYLRGRLKFISRVKLDYLAVERFVLAAKKRGVPHDLKPLFMEFWHDITMLTAKRRKSARQIERLETKVKKIDSWPAEGGPLANIGTQDTQATVDELYHYLDLVGTAPFPSALVFFWSGHQEIRRFGGLWADRGTLTWLQHPGQTHNVIVMR